MSVTEMVCTASDGNHIPTALIVKSRNPVCFELQQGEPIPLPYKDQSNACFDKDVTFRYIKIYFGQAI